MVSGNSFEEAKCSQKDETAFNRCQWLDFFLKKKKVGGLQIKAIKGT